MYSCVEPEIGLPAADSGAQLALIDQFVACVDPPVGLQAVVLGEPGGADVTLVRLLPCVYPQVVLQLGSFYRGVVTVRVAEGLLVRVLVPHVLH